MSKQLFVGLHIGEEQAEYVNSTDAEGRTALLLASAFGYALTTLFVLRLLFFLFSSVPSCYTVNACG